MPSKVRLKLPKTKGEVIEKGMETLISPLASWARRRLAENIMPWNYEEPGRSSMKRGAEAIILGKKEPARAEIEQYLQKGYGRVATDEDKLRLDLLSMYGGIKPKYGTMKESQHRPSTEQDKSVKYLDSHIIKRELSKQLPPIKSKQDFENYVNSAKSSEILRKDGKVVRGETGGVKSQVAGLGTANVSYGEDAKGPYVSYYDKWDIDPSSGMYAEKGGTWSEATKKAGATFLGAGSKPPEIYGRIYFDKKTGKPIL